MASADEDDLRKRARELVERRQQAASESEEATPESILGKPKRKASELAKAAVAPGAGIVSLLAIVGQLVSARVSPEQLTALRERVDQLETDRAARRLTEFERDKIENCRGHQLDGFVASLLPRRDQLVGPPPKPWFDQCPDLPEPTTGAKAAPKE